jgi:iron(III) transport system permease protein
MTEVVGAPEPLVVARRRLSSVQPQHVVYGLLLLIVAIFVLYPVVILIANSFVAGQIGQPRHWSLDGWRIALTDPAMLPAIWNTVKILVANEAISLPLAVGLAWLLARSDLPWRGGLEFMFWITFFLPSLSVTLGWIVLLDPQNGLLNQLLDSVPFIASRPFDIYSFWGIVWAHLTTSSLSIKVMLLTPSFRNLDASFEEAARASGASAWQSLRRIVLPIMAPAILTVLVLSAIRAMQTFEIEMVLGPPFGFWVYGTKIYTLVAQVPPEFGPATALATIGFALITPLILIQRWLLTRKDYTSVTGRIKLMPVALGIWRTPLFVLVLLMGLVMTVVPVGLLVVASFMKLFGFFNIPQPWTLMQWQKVLSGDFFVQSLTNTVVVAGGTAIVSMLFSALIAYFTIRSRYVGRGVLDFLSWLPFAIPGVLLSVGLLYVFLGNPLLRPLYGSLVLLVVAMVIASMTLGTQILKATMAQLGAGLEEAARTSGASWWYGFRHVLVPILMPTLVLVGMISFIAAARDISSVALLATNATKTLSLLQLDYMVDGRSEAATVVSVIVIMLTTGVALLARMFGLRLGLRE